MSEVREQAVRAREAARKLASTSTRTRDAALTAMADALVERAPEIIAANTADMEAAGQAGTPAPLLDRLMLDDERIAGSASALRELARQPDPLGEVIMGRTLPNGISLTEVRVPL